MIRLITSSIPVSYCTPINICMNSVEHNASVYLVSLYTYTLYSLYTVQLRNKNLIDSIQDEESAIMDLRVKLKVLPFKQQLNFEEGTIVS